MKYFSPGFIDFFNELSVNNHKEWFHAQKKQYENSVKQPFQDFVNALIHEIQKEEPDLLVEAKDCILRINRDIRFAKDKTPYNLHTTAFVSKGGRKNKSIPGIFIRFSPKMVGIMGGCFGPDKGQLTSIRQSIIDHPHALRNLLETPSFQKKFGAMKGDQMKRVPVLYQAAAEKEPLILHKQYYFMAEEKPALITSDRLLSTIMDYYQAMKPVNNYLEQAIQATYS